MKSGDQLIVTSIVEVLRKKIISGELPPGKKMREVELSAEFCVSRTPIREAFRVLQSEGLLTYIPRCGVMVADWLDDLKVFEMIQVWGLLSTEASFLAAMNATDSEKAELLRIQDIMERDPFEPNKMGNLDHRLHGAIAKISRNSALYDYVCDIQSHLGSLAFATQFNERRYVNSVMEHKNMVDAIVNGHAELARAYTQIHFQLSAAFHRGNVQEFNQRLSGKKGP